MFLFARLESVLVPRCTNVMKSSGAVSGFTAVYHVKLNTIVETIRATNVARAAGLLGDGCIYFLRKTVLYWHRRRAGRIQVPSGEGLGDLESGLASPLSSRCASDELEKLL
jgi:hypothetical protein